MTYTVIFLRIFVKQFRHLPRDARNRVTVRVEEVVGQLEGFWKDRVGQYRILYAIDEKNKTIILHDVDLRKRVYD